MTLAELEKLGKEYYESHIRTNQIFFRVVHASETEDMPSLVQEFGKEYRKQCDLVLRIAAAKIIDANACEMDEEHKAVIEAIVEARIHD